MIKRDFVVLLIENSVADATKLRLHISQLEAELDRPIRLVYTGEKRAGNNQDISVEEALEFVQRRGLLDPRIDLAVVDLALHTRLPPVVQETLDRSTATPLESHVIGALGGLLVAANLRNWYATTPIVLFSEYSKNPAVRGALNSMLGGKHAATSLIFYVTKTREGYKDLIELIRRFMFAPPSEPSRSAGKLTTRDLSDLAYRLIHPDTEA